MATFEINGNPIASARVSNPLTGVMVADLSLVSSLEDTGLAVDEPASLDLDGVVWAVTVERAADMKGTAHIRAVAGKNKLARAVLKPRYYEGAAWAAIVADAVRDAGENVGTINLGGFCSRYVRPATTAKNVIESVLARFSGKTWRVNSSGSVDITAPEWAAFPPPYTARRLDPVVDCLYMPLTAALEPAQTVVVQEVVRRVGYVVHTVGGNRQTIAYLERGE